MSTFGGGIVASQMESPSLYATADYATNPGGEKERIIERISA